MFFYMAKEGRVICINTASQKEYNLILEISVGYTDVDIDKNTKFVYKTTYKHTELNKDIVRRIYKSENKIDIDTKLFFKVSLIAFGYNIKQNENFDDLIDFTTTNNLFDYWLETGDFNVLTEIFNQEKNWVKFLFKPKYPFVKYSYCNILYFLDIVFNVDKDIAYRFNANCAYKQINDKTYMLGLIFSHTKEFYLDCLNNNISDEIYDFNFKTIYEEIYTVYGVRFDEIKVEGLDNGLQKNTYKRPIYLSHRQFDEEQSFIIMDKNMPEQIQTNVAKNVLLGNKVKLVGYLNHNLELYKYELKKQV